jgi:hypothetical protein
MNRSDAIAGKLAAALRLQRMGVAMMRQSLVRRYPSDSSAEIDARLTHLLLHRPEAEHGDGDGIVGRWPRTRP